MKKNWTEIRSRTELQRLLDREDVFSTRANHKAWGYFVALKSMGYFCWFETPEEMLMHLVQVEVLHSPNHVSERTEYEQFVQQLIPIAQNWLKQTNSAEQTCSALNQVFPDFSIDWLGTFEDLCHQSGRFENKVRLAFRGKEEPSILSEQSEAFMDFLENYGL